MTVANALLSVLLTTSVALTMVLTTITYTRTNSLMNLDPMCWDVNHDKKCQAVEDTNQDGVCSVLDCVVPNYGFDNIINTLALRSAHGGVEVSYLAFDSNETGYVEGHLSSYEEYYNFTTVFNGGLTTNTSKNLIITKVGSLVNVFLPALSVTCDATADFSIPLTALYLPARFRPKTAYDSATLVTTSNAAQDAAPGVARFATTGQITITRNSFSHFNTSATCGWNAAFFTFQSAQV
jgi:hypothetical protein